MRRAIIPALVITLGSLLGIFFPVSSQAQSDQPLSFPLMFSADPQGEPLSIFDTLIWANGVSQSTPFYINQVGTVQAISWSPSGQYLAVLRGGDLPEVLQICVLDRSGQLHTCFDEKISRYVYNAFYDNYTVSWSTDEQRAYFVVGQERTVKLIEADVQTGETLRTLFQPPQFHESPPLIHWTPAVDYVAVYFGDQTLLYRYSSDYDDVVIMRPGIVVNLQTQEQVELQVNVPDQSFFYFCEGFSPQGSYLAARVYTHEDFPDYDAAYPPLLGLALLDKTGEVVQMLDQAELAQYGIDWMHCPAWQGEETLYFLGGAISEEESPFENRGIFRYSFSDDTLTEVKRFGPETRPGFPQDPLIPSPDGTAIAFRFGDGGIMSEIAVLLPAGDIARLNQPYERGIHPVWVPPLAAP